MITTRIGPYGPFHLNGLFAFSDFEQWGRGHNNGFVACVEACRGKRCVLDVGAHIGLVSLSAASVLAPGGRVYCFEPAEANRRLLESHVAINRSSGVIEIIPHLVGDEDRDGVNFFESDEPTGMNSVVVTKNPQAYQLRFKRQITIDTFCATHKLAPEILKIDVEGAELAVLRGGRRTLARHRPSIFLSVHPRALSLLGESGGDLKALIRELDYECRHIDGSPVDEFALREYLLLPGGEKRCP